MKTTLQHGLDAIAACLLDAYPGTTGAMVRAAWDKVVAGSALAAGFEAAAGAQIAINRPVLDALLAKEQAANRSAILTGIAQAATDFRAYRALTTPTAAQRLQFEDRVCTALLKLGRIALSDYSGTD
jgi:hypothetical protein